MCANATATGTAVVLITGTLVGHTLLTLFVSLQMLVQHSTCLLLPPTSRLSESANYNTNSSIIYPTIAHIYIHPQFLTEVRRGLIAKHLGHFPICAPSSPNQLVVLHLSRHAQPSVGLLVEDTQLLQVHLVSDTK